MMYYRLKSVKDFVILFMGLPVFQIWLPGKKLDEAIKEMMQIFILTLTENLNRI